MPTTISRTETTQTDFQQGILTGVMAQASGDLTLNRTGYTGDVVPAMTSATTPSPYVVTESSAYSDSTKGWKAFDHVSTSRWIATAIPCWVQVDLGQPRVIARYGIYYTNEVNGLWYVAPNVFKFQGSNDGQNWTDLDSRSGIAWSTPETKYFDVANPQAYRYYRLYVIQPLSGSGVEIYEIYLYEAIYSTAGTRISPAFNLDMAGRFLAGSKITWQANVPSGTELTIKCAVNNSPTVAPQEADFMAVESGKPVPGLCPGENPSGKYLWVKQYLSTTSTAITPALQEITVSIIGWDLWKDVRPAIEEVLGFAPESSYATYTLVLLDTDPVSKVHVQQDTQDNFASENLQEGMSEFVASGQTARVRLVFRNLGTVYVRARKIDQQGNASPWETWIVTGQLQVHAIDYPNVRTTGPRATHVKVIGGDGVASYTAVISPAPPDTAKEEIEVKIDSSDATVVQTVAQRTLARLGQEQVTVEVTLPLLVTTDFAKKLRIVIPEIGLDAALPIQAKRHNVLEQTTTLSLGAFAASDEEIVARIVDQLK